MPVDNNQTNPLSNPFGSEEDSSQQDWLGLDQQGLAGETLKAKKWTAKRRVVDSNQHVGNIHTGTEKAVELDKTDSLSGELLQNQSAQKHNTSEGQNSSALIAETTPNSESFTDSFEQKENADSRTTEVIQRLADEEQSSTQQNESAPLVFEEHFEETSAERSSADGQRKSIHVQQAATAQAPEERADESSPTVTTISSAPEIIDPVVSAAPTSIASTPAPPPPSSAPVISTPPPPPKDANGDDGSIQITIENSSSTPTLNVIDSRGLEDNAVAIELSSTLTDTDGSETLSITIEGVPGGATLSAGTDLGNGIWKLTPDELPNLTLLPPSNSDNNFSLTITATSTERNGGASSSVSELIDVYLEAVADSPLLTAMDAKGEEDTAINLNITTALTDLDGSETLSTITFSDVPKGAIFSTGINNQDGTWSVEANDLEGLTITAPENSGADFRLGLSVTATDTDGVTATSTTSIPVSVAAINDAPVITGSQQLTITEDSMEGFNGYGQVWEGDVYSVVTQAEMLAHLGITDVDSSNFTVSLANANTAWHDGLQANDSTFRSDTLASGSARGDESVIQVTQGLLDNYPTINAQVGDFYFDHVDFDKLSAGEIANINFSVQVSDGQTTSEASNFGIVVTGSNDAPVVSGAVILPEGTEDTTQSFTSADLLANTTDIDTNDTLSVTNVTIDPSQGILSTNIDGSFLFTPKANFNGDVTVIYDVTDGTDTISTTATINLHSVNDAPLAVNDSTSILLDPNDTGNLTDGAPTGIRVTGLYAQGSDENMLDGKAELTTLSNHTYFEHNSLGHTGYNYMGGHNWFADNGIDRSELKGGIITFEDGTKGIIDTGSNGVSRDYDNDGVPDYQENAYIYYNAFTGNDPLLTNEDTTLTITQQSLLANDTDVDGDPLSIVAVSEAAVDSNGNVVGSTEQDNNGNIIFTPGETLNSLNEGEISTVTFNYTVSDGQGGTSTATTTVKIVGTNDAPTLETISATTVAEDGTQTIRFQAADIDGTVATTATAEHGTVSVNDKTGEITYTPDADYNGTDAIVVTATDNNSATAVQSIAVTVNEVNDAPIAVNDSTSILLDPNDTGNLTDGAPTGTRVTGLYAQGSDENMLDGKTELTTLSNHTYFEHNSLGHTGYNYMGGHNWFADNGIDRSELKGGIITFEDGTKGIIDTGSNGVSRDHDNDGVPDYQENAYIYYNAFAGNDTLLTNEDTPLTITQQSLLANDTDVDGDPLSIVAVSEVAVDSNGNVVGSTAQDNDGNIIFTPGETLNSLNEGETSTVTFNYTVSDGQGGTSTATTNIVVQGTNNDLTYISETAGYRNVVGIYQIDANGNPTSGTVVIDDQNGMAGGTHLANLEPGNHDFFIIANGAGEINNDSTISFDNSSDRPVLLINGTPAVHPVYYTEPGFNPDGKDHFQFESDGKGGTNINIEDLPNLGDADFGDVVLNTNFEMVDRTAVGSLSDSNQTVNSVDENATAGTDTGITATAVDADGDAVSYSLSNDAGGRFSINSGTGKVTVASDDALNFDSATSHDITVEATSSDGTISTENFSIEVGDVQENLIPTSLSETQSLSIGGPPSVTSNVTFIVDVSSSMSDKDLALTEDAISSIVAQYNEQGDVHVNIVQFWGDNNESTGWQGSDSSISLYTNKSGTDPEQGLQAAVNAYDGTEPQADNNSVYVFADGNSYGDYKTDFNAFVPTWNSFVGKHIDTLQTVGVNSGSLGDLNTIAEAGDNKPIYVNNVNDLQNIVSDIATVPDISSVTGNILDNVSGGDGAISITAITVDGTDHTENDMPITTPEGASLNVNFNTGEYIYSGNAENFTTNTTEAFSVTATDADGDSTGFDVTINVDVPFEDSSSTLKQALSAEQKKESTSNILASVAVATVATDTVMQDFNNADNIDISLNIPSLSLPGEEQENGDSNQETNSDPTTTQETIVPNQSNTPEGVSAESLQQNDTLSSDDLSHSLPSASLSNLFDQQVSVASDESKENEEDSTEKQVSITQDHAVADPIATSLSSPKLSINTTESNEGNENDIETVTDTTTTTEPENVTAVGNDPQTSDAPAISNVQPTSLSASNSSVNTEQPISTSASDPLVASDQQSTPDTPLTTDNLSISSSVSSNDVTQEATPQTSSSLDSFSTDKTSTPTTSNELDQFSANDPNNTSTATSEMTSVDQLSTTTSDTSTPADAGLSASDGIQEELPPENEPVDTNIG